MNFGMKLDRNANDFENLQYNECAHHFWRLAIISETVNEVIISDVNEMLNISGISDFEIDEKQGIFSDFDERTLVKQLVKTLLDELMMSFGEWTSSRIGYIVTIRRAQWGKWRFTKRAKFVSRGLKPSLWGAL